MLKKVAQVIPLIRLKRDLNYFDYLIPNALQGQIKIGQLVEIPFRNKNVKGVVLNLVESSKFENEKLKCIEKIIDPLPFLQNWQLDLIKFMSEHYFVSMAMVLKMIMPEIPKKTGLAKETLWPEIKFRSVKSQAEFDFKTAEKPVLLQYFKFEDKIKVYLGLIERSLKQYKQILIIAPTLIDLKKIYQYLGDYKNEISVFLNDLPKNKYWYECLRIKNNQVKIIMGTRSAIFAPFNNLDLITIDEEDNENHKQEEPNPRYNVKTAAIKLKELLKCKVIFTALTPSLNSLYKVVQKDWQYFEINKLKDKPEIKIINRAEEFKKGNYSVFSEELCNKIGENLQQKKQIFLFLNRKGTFTQLNCKDCGYIANCPTCHLPLTYYASQELICHHCGFRQDLFLFCPNCQSPNLKITGIGTERIEIEIKKLFPKIKVLKLDLATPLNNKDIDEFEIIIGTSYALDFINWQKINLIGVINADTLFYLPDFRSLEKTFNILMKMAIFLGNKKEMLVQTFSPHNFIFKALKNLDTKMFYEQEFKDRQELNYPPFCQLIKLIYQNIEFNYGQKQIEEVYTFLNSKAKENKIIVNPPLLVYTQQVRGRWRWQIIIKITDKNISLDFLKELPEDIIIDVEPERLL